jgi:DNA polymerase-1
MMSRLLIVDGHAYAYRAFHAIRELRSPGGGPTNAIYGFIKMLGKLRAGLSPSHVMVVWDGGLDAGRVAMLPEYKAQRPEMPGELAVQLNGISQYLAAAGLASFCGDGIEADDYIAGLALRAVAAGFTVVIASSDKDFMQLVQPGIGLVNPNDKSERVWGAAEVRDKTGVEPAQVVDWLSLVGDNVDNIPGVPGVGPKRAAELLGQLGSIENLYARLGEVKSERMRGAVAASVSVVRRNQELVRLKCDLPAEFVPAELVVRAPDVAQLAGLFRAWGFRSMLAELAGSDEAAGAQAQAQLLLGG